MNLGTLAEIAGRADEQSRLAESHYANALDGQNQLRSRHRLAEQALAELRNGRVANGEHKLELLVMHCPSAESVRMWFNQAREMLDQAKATRAELSEGIAKLRELEETRVRHGGTA